MENYFTIDSMIEYEEKIKRSTFLVTLAPVSDIKSAKEFISSTASKYKTASHNCWAYIVGNKAEISHSSDAGEPSGTAGKPMLHALQKSELSNVAAVVTRYFGGVKLGVRGLIDAYGSTVEKAIAKVALIKIVEITKFNLQTTYDFLDILKYNLSKLNAKIDKLEYSDVIKVNILVEETDILLVEEYLTEIQNSGKIIRN
jgi:uncharacterized YigZ family protein